jgi:hypothetical protein
LGFPQSPTTNDASSTATPSRRVVIELPANSTESTISRFGQKTSESITTIEDILKHVKNDPSLIEDSFINIYKCAVYTSDFVPLSLSAPIGILRDGENLIVTYHGGADNIVVQEKQPVNAKNPMGVSAFPGTFPAGSIEINSSLKYDSNALDDDVFGDELKTGTTATKGVYDDDNDSFTKATSAKSKISAAKVKSPRRSTVDSGEYEFNKPSVKKQIEISKIGLTKGRSSMDYAKKIGSTSSISSMGSLDDEEASPSFDAHGNSHRIKPKLSAYGNLDEDIYDTPSKPAKSNSSMSPDRSRSKEHSSSRSDSKNASSPSKSRTAPSIPAPIPQKSGGITSQAI